MKPFGKLLTMNDSDVQSWLIKVDRNNEIKTLVTAMLGADETVNNRIFANMSPRASTELKQDISSRQTENTGVQDITAAALKLERLF